MKDNPCVICAERDKEIWWVEYRLREEEACEIHSGHTPLYSLRGQRAGLRFKEMLHESVCYRKTQWFR